MWSHVVYSHTIVMCSYYHIVSEDTRFQCTKMMCVDMKKMQYKNDSKMDVSKHVLV